MLGGLGSNSPTYGLCPAVVATHLRTAVFILYAQRAAARAVGRICERQQSDRWQPVKKGRLLLTRRTEVAKRYAGTEVKRLPAGGSAALRVNCNQMPAAAHQAWCLTCAAA